MPEDRGVTLGCISIEMCNPGVTPRPEELPWSPTNRARDRHRRARRARLEADHRGRALGRWFGDAGAEIDLRPGGEMVLRWTDTARARPRGRGRAAHPLLLSLGAVQGPGRRGAGRGQLDAGRVHARARGRRHAAAGGRERLLLARRPRTTQRAGNHAGNTEGWRRSSTSCARTRSGSASDVRAGGERVRRAGGPDPLARAQPARRTGRGHRDVAGRRVAGQPRGGRQAPGGARSRRSRRRPARGP